MTLDETTISGNGHGSTSEIAETEEELKVIRKKMDEVARGSSPILSLSKQDIGLLKQLIHSPEKSDEFIRIVQICDFLDEDERNRELEAYYEAVRLGMSTEYNIAHALSCASINRKGAHRNSRVAALLDALSHQKITSNTPKGNNGNSNAKSPLA